MTDSAVVSLSFSEESLLKKKEKDNRVVSILKRMNEFFDPINFKKIDLKKENFDPDYHIKDVYDEISNNPNAIGFYYLIAEEDNRKIVYSKKHKKAVIWFNCC